MCLLFSELQAVSPIWRVPRDQTGRASIDLSTALCELFVQFKIRIWAQSYS